ncbi:MAG: AAA family ATPase [Candidatus Promineifilaceae bacterium]|nr:AAA family ATPase [Candidatus Promineifilaceae bacterium]
MDSIASFGYWVRRRRKTLDLTQSTLAQRVGCSVVTIRKIERDERRPSRQMAELLADHLLIADTERDNFIRMGRGDFVASIASPLEIPSFPDFLQTWNRLSQQEDTPFVAREEELTQLDGYLKRALRGRGSVAFVTGGPGRGKTVLVQEFARRAQEGQADLVVVSGNCNAHTGVGDPYLPFREILGLLTGDIEDRWTAGTIDRENAQRLWSLTPHSLQALANNGPDLINIFIPGPTLLTRAAAIASGRVDWLAQLQNLATRQEAGQSPVKKEQRDLFEQYAKTLQALARQRSLLLVLDDLQWADTGSINLLFHLGRRLEGSNLLIIGIYRPADVALGRGGERHPLESVVGEFQRHFGQNQVDLRKTENKQFVEALLDSEPNRLGAAFRKALYQHARGHALFTVEMIRGMQERGDLIQDEHGSWVEGSALDWETLPARIEGVIGERIGRLPLALQDMLQVASIEGESFTAEIVAQVLGTGQQGIISQLSRILDRQHRLVMGQSSHRLGEEGPRLSRYRFRHILYQKYLYNLLDDVERSYLHEAVGTALEQFYKGRSEEVAGQVARHFQAAGLTQKAVSYLRQAGERAVQLSAHEEAIVHFTTALNLLETQPDTPTRAGQELQLQMALSGPLITAKGYGAPETVQTFDQARQLAEQTGDTSQVFPLLYGKWTVHASQAEHQDALKLGELLMDLANRQSDASMLMMGHRLVGISLLILGQAQISRTYLEQALALYDPPEHESLAFRYGQNPRVSIQVYLSLGLWLLGYPDQALHLAGQAIAYAHQLNHVNTLAYVMHFGGAQLCQMVRDVERVEEFSKALITFAQKHKLLFWLAGATIFEGWALVGRGEAAAGVARMLKGLADWQAQDSKLFLPHYLTLLAEGYIALGEVQEGLAVIREALIYVDETEEREWEAELHRLNGELLLILGESEAKIEAKFQQAINIARRQEVKSLELRATVSLARLWRSLGRGEESRQMLAEIYNWFKEGFDTFDLKEAKSLLEELS